MAEDRQIGTVKWFSNSKGYGFIEREGQQGDIFVHYSGIRGDGYRTLDKGTKVEFNIVEGTKGLQAQDVVMITQG
jgi:CspA family cold shock protein